MASKQFPAESIAAEDRMMATWSCALSYLSGELSLSILGCSQVLRQLLVLHSILQI